MPAIEMPSLPRPRRAALVRACSVCMCLSFLTPAPAHAKMQQPGRAGAHKPTVRKGCAAKRRNDRQSSPTHFVIPFYVMTLDMLTLYDPGAPSTDRARFDLPDESFTVT